MNTNTNQIFTIPTFDAAFKWILSLDSIRPSFFHAFLPDLTIETSERLDDHMNPVQALQLVRHFVHDEKTQKIIDNLGQAGLLEVHVANLEEELKHNKAATEFLNTIIARFEDIKKSFPKPRFDGTMDFVCRLNTGECALIEMQVAPQDYWDRRALAYAAALYGNQMREGTKWGEIKRVIAINILGGGHEERSHWKDTPDQYMRQYKMQEQLHGEARFLDGIELIQYSLENAPKEFKTQEQKDWLLFFKNAHNMTEKDVTEQIKTPAVLVAFERARIKDLPSEVRKSYEAEDAEYNRFSIHNAETFANGRVEGKAEGVIEGKKEGVIEGKKEAARNLLKLGFAITAISEACGLSEEEIKSL